MLFATLRRLVSLAALVASFALVAPIGATPCRSASRAATSARVIVDSR